MKYLLADTLVYNDEDGSVSLVDTPDVEPQVMTATANSIMKMLVLHHGNVVEREAFLHDVWDERGLQGSNNSLNQYISILRKTAGKPRARDVVYCHRAQSGLYAECGHHGPFPG
jgi:DNA-binding winged-HTH domains